ncbi:MAG: hypothetical protein AAF639_30105 [Chloroflexota bacterium]
MNHYRLWLAIIGLVLLIVITLRAMFGAMDASNEAQTARATAVARDNLAREAHATAEANALIAQEQAAAAADAQRQTERTTRLVQAELLATKAGTLLVPSQPKDDHALVDPLDNAPPMAEQMLLLARDAVLTTLLTDGDVSAHAYTTLRRAVQQVGGPHTHQFGPPMFADEMDALVEETGINLIHLVANPFALDSEGTLPRVPMRLVTLNYGKNAASFEGFGHHFNAVAISPEGERIASASGDPYGYSAIRVWSMDTKQELARLTGFRGEIHAIAFSPDGAHIVSAGFDGRIRIWDAWTGQVLTTLGGQNGEQKGFTWSVAYHPDGKRLASAGSDAIIRLWDVETGEEVAQFTAHADGDSAYKTVRTVAFSSDGKRLVSGSDDKTVRIWDVETGAELLRLEGHKHHVDTVAFHPDGQTVVSGSGDSTIRLWDARTGESLAVLTGHSRGTSTVAISPNGRHIISGGADDTVRIWDAYTGRQLTQLDGHIANVTALAISPDGQTIVSGSGSPDNSLILWSMPERLVLEAMNHLPASPRSEDIYAQLNLTGTVQPPSKTVLAQLEQQAQVLRLMDSGRALARRGQITNAITYFEQAQSLDSTLSTDPMTLAQTLHRTTIHTHLFAGRSLAQHTRFDDALSEFEKAITHDNTLNIDGLAADAFIEAGRSFTWQAAYPQAIDAYQHAQAYSTTAQIPADYLNILCWRGTLNGLATDVLPLCEQAVAQAPDNGNFRDSRGLARALAGDVAGAIDDFKMYVAWAAENETEWVVDWREQWIAALEEGEVPVVVFNESVLAALRAEEP